MGRRGPFGILSQPSQILSCLLLVGWATSTNAESEKTILCTSGSGDEAAVCGTVNSLPDHLVCNLEPEAVSPLSQNDALTLAERISKNCVITHRKCPKTGEKRMLPFQVAVSLVSKFNEFSPEILTSLGQVAVGLSVPQIEFGIRNDDLLASLPSLSKVRGWNAQQAEAILSKLFHSGYQIQDGRSLAALGSLLAGLDLDQLQEIPPSMVLDALKVPGFATLLENLSPSQKKVLVDKLIAATDGFKELVACVPVELAPYVPKSLLVPVSEFSIQDLNGKPWTQEQAAVFFDDVIGSVHNFSSLCPSILHGFTCATARNLDTERLRELAKAMKEKKVQLGKHQLLCLAERLMLRGIPHDFNDYPEELVLFVSPSDYGAIGSCKEYFARVGKANVDVLEKGSSQRERLLAEALDCLKISGPHVSRGNAEILGRLACDLSAEYFKTSGRNLLKQLRECRSFSPDQVKAIQALLCSGNTPVGPPSEWTSSTLEELSGLFHVFDRCILQKIPASVLTPRLKCLLHKSHLPRKDLAAFMKNLWSPRLKRSSGSECPPDKIITDEMAQDELLPIDYTTAEELRSCLPDEVFLRNLGYLSEFAFADEQLAMMKDKLDRIYSDGYPDSVLRNLGNFMTLMTPEDIKKWKFNSSETLAALLANEPSPEIATAIIRQYIDNGGPVDGILGRFVNLMTPEDIKKWRFNSTETLTALLANDTSPELAAAIIRQYRDNGGPVDGVGGFMTFVKNWRFNSTETLAALLANDTSPELAAAIIRQYIDNGGPVNGILGSFVPLMTPEDIKKWRFNSTETLAALLRNDTSPELAAAIIRQYRDNGGPVDGGFMTFVKNWRFNSTETLAALLANDTSPELAAAIIRQYTDNGGPLDGLGGFMTFVSPEDIKKWRFNSTETLAALLANNTSPELNATIIRQYIDNGGPLDAEALNICLVEPDQLKKIDENAIRAAKPLNLSSCNQTTKDILYPKAKRAFSDRHNTPQYYELIKPYLEGAPAEDLRALVKDNVNMDIDTFMKLRKDSVLELTPSEVKGLLGKNLRDLKAQEDKPPVKDWRLRQKQSELKRLGFGVRGGRPEGYMNIKPRNNN